LAWKAIFVLKLLTIPGTIPRKLYKNVRWQDEYGDTHIGRDIATEADAEVVSSKVASSRWDDLHAPVLDIDFEAELVPSTTPGHYHLYLDKMITWRQYKRIIKALAKAGIIEKGYAEASIGRRHTAVRVPWLRKET
jgi:hypothetical protein